MKVIIAAKGNGAGLQSIIPAKLNGLVLVKIEVKHTIFGSTVYVCTYEEVEDK